MAESPQIVEAEPRRLLASRVQVRWDEIGEAAMTALEQVWNHIRAAGVQGYGHNVFLYENQSAEGASVAMGVEVPEAVEAPEGFEIALTPSGTAATLAHTGPYDGLAAATQRLLDWCTEHHHQPGGASWEVYGDWDNDPEKLRTDIYIRLKP
jgi:effector-binding domain-containing protein